LKKKITGYGKILSDRNYLDSQLNRESLQFIQDYCWKLYSDADRIVYNKMVEKFISIELEHLTQEEEDVFPMLQLFLSDIELKNLCEKWKSGRENAPTHPHPSAPMKHGSKFIHPITGAVDKFVDSLSCAPPTTISSSDPSSTTTSSNVPSSNIPSTSSNIVIDESPNILPSNIQSSSIPSSNLPSE